MEENISVEAEESAAPNSLNDTFRQRHLPCTPSSPGEDFCVRRGLMSRADKGEPVWHLGATTGEDEQVLW